MKFAAALAVVAALAAVRIAAWQNRTAQTATAELKVARQARATLAARVAEMENKIPSAERRAAETERDTGELLRAVEAVTGVRAPRPARPATTLPIKSRPAMTAGEPDGIAPEERERLAYERAYQQALARKRAEELKRKGELDWLATREPPALLFKHRLEAAEERVAKGDFQAAIRLLNEAMANKPADEPVSEKIRQLQAMLQAQDGRVEITFVSDEVTFVMIDGVQQLGKFQRRTVQLPPGDYPVTGLRQGYEKASFLVQVRNGVPFPAIAVTCTQPARN